MFSLGRFRFGLRDHRWRLTTIDPADRQLTVGYVVRRKLSDCKVLFIAKPSLGAKIVSIDTIHMSNLRPV
jgi:hypothetical protein